VPGARTQDEAAEDPFTAARLGLTPNYELYWTNKLQLPLKEVFSTCLTAEQLRQLLHGPHTSIRASTAAGGTPIAPTSVQLHLAAGGQDHLAGRTNIRLGSPSGSTPGKGATGRKGKCATVSPAKVGAGKGVQRGLGNFFQQSAKCLVCKQVLQQKPIVLPDSSQASSRHPPPGVSPALCDRCSSEDGKWEAAYLSVEEEDSAAAGRFCAAHSACCRCHSGSHLGMVVCENGECSVLYARFASERQLKNAEHKLERLEW